MLGLSLGYLGGLEGYLGPPWLSWVMLGWCRGFCSRHLGASSSTYSFNTKTTYLFETQTSLSLSPRRAKTRQPQTQHPNTFMTQHCTRPCVFDINKLTVWCAQYTCCRDILCNMHNMLTSGTHVCMSYVSVHVYYVVYKLLSHMCIEHVIVCGV